MNVILENYLIIVLVGLFFVFALIGYLIDMLRNTNMQKKEEKPNIKPVEIATIDNNALQQEKEEIPTIPKINQEQNNADELLENYDKDSK